MAEVQNSTVDILKVTGQEIQMIDREYLKNELPKLNSLVVGTRDIFEALETKIKSYRGRRDAGKLAEELNVSFKENKQKFLDSLGIVTLSDAEKNKTVSNATTEAIKNKATADSENARAQEQKEAQAKAQEKAQKEAQAKAQKEADSARAKIDGVG